MPSENCCAAHGELRVIYYESTSGVVQSVYTVPVGKVFVLTAWTIVNEAGQRIAVRLHRDQEPVGYNRISDPMQAFHHLTFPTGVAFAAGSQIQLKAPNNVSQHFFYGYEHDEA